MIIAEIVIQRRQRYVGEISVYLPPFLEPAIIVGEAVGLIDEFAKGKTIEKITGKEYDTYNYTGH